MEKITGLHKHDYLKDVWVITDMALVQSGKSIDDIAKELSKGKKVFIYPDTSLRATYISINKPLKLCFR